MKPRFESGQWNVICDTCGFKFKSGELKETWDHRWVCPDDWEPRHISDFLRPPAPEKPLPYIRPEPAEIAGGPIYISESIGTQETELPPASLHGGLVTLVPDWINELGADGLWFNDSSTLGQWE